TRILVEQTGKTKGRFSSRAFLYRLGDEVTGVYWPDLHFRRGGELREKQFRHVFGKCLDGAVVELIGVDSSSDIWEFPDVGASFRLDPTTAMHLHDRSRTPETPNDWLRYDVRDIESILSGGDALEPRRLPPR
ncbi:MAG: hypothetical protein KDB80_03730, partial [Planctomycetes bacterium]|nr:hypothetical protein [Planctomycetota bacterium]